MHISLSSYSHLLQLGYTYAIPGHPIHIVKEVERENGIIPLEPV